MSRRLHILLWVLTLGGLAPLLAGALAAMIASRAGCTLSEAAPAPCVLAGHDWGPQLYGLLVSAWLGLLTVPVGLASGAFLAIAALRRRFSASRINED